MTVKYDRSGMRTDGIRKGIPWQDAENIRVLKVQNGGSYTVVFDNCGVVQATSQGRNGLCKTAGIEVVKNTYRNTVMLSAVNTKGNTINGHIEIPMSVWEALLQEETTPLITLDE